MLVAHNKVDGMLHLVTGQRVLYRSGQDPDNLRRMAAGEAYALTAVGTPL
jgi:hypothetical protein